MEHLYLRLPHRRVLLADVHRSTDGQGIGYGTMLIRLRRVLVFGQMAQVPVFCVPSRKALNTAVTRLQSEDVAIIMPESWSGRVLTLVWHVAAPFRVGNPALWAARSVARAIVGPFYSWLERSTWRPRRVRRFLLRQAPIYRRLKAINAAYAHKAEALWQRRYEREAVARLRAWEDAGHEAPPLRLRLPPDGERRVTEDVAALGVDPAAPLVTVHVREAGYRATAGLRQRGWDHIRNARVETFLPALTALVDRGYTVVRLGDPTMTPIDVPGVLDLTASPRRNAWLDIWCTLRSEFLIGSDSGPSWLAMLLGVPILTVNAVHLRDLTRQNDRIICKLARDRVTGETLSIAEMLTEDFLRAGFKGDRYDAIDNTPEDIRRAVLDMIEVVHGRERRSSWQNRFNRQLRALERQTRDRPTALEGVAIMGRARGTLARGFARKYFVREPVLDVERVSND